MSKVIVEVDGITFSNWKDISITKDMNSICGSFTMTAYYDYTGTKTPWNLSGVIKIFYLDDMVGLRLEGDSRSKHKVMTGYVETVNTSITSSGLSVSISGRDITCDLVDCTMNNTNPSNTESKNLTVMELYESFLAPYDLSVWALLTEDKLSQKIERKNHTPNEKIGDVIISISKELGIIPSTDEDGSLFLENKIGSASNGKLVLGKDGNILEASHNSDHTKRYGKIVMLGNADSALPDLTADGGSVAIDGIAVDPTYSLKTLSKKERERILTLTSANSGVNDIAKLEEEANWRMTLSRAGVSVTKVKVQGWIAGESRLWRINQTVECDLSLLGLKKTTMLIKSLTFEISDNGSFTNLELIHADSFEDRTFKTEDGEKTKNYISVDYGDAGESYIQ